MGAHSAGRKTWALGRRHRLNRVLEGLFVAGLIAAAAAAGWVSFTPPPPWPSLNPPPTVASPDRPDKAAVPPVPAASLRAGPTPTVASRLPRGKREKTAATPRTPRATPRATAPRHGPGSCS